MKLGLAFASSIAIDGADALEVCRVAEEAGFESVWGGEHVVMPSTITSRYPYTADGQVPAQPDTPIPDPLVWLAFAAAATTRVRLGTCILIVPQRNPLVLAKELATLDRLSGGRVELGLGVGWLREEFEALGVPWERRGARNDEYVAAMRALWHGPHAEFHGEFVDFERASVNPKPVHGRVPITVGGHSRAAAERAGRLGDGFFPGKGDIAELADIVRQTAADAGRDPESIEITFGDEAVLGDDPVGAVERLADAGVDRVIVPSFLFLADPESALAEFGERVIAPTAHLGRSRGG